MRETIVQEMTWSAPLLGNTKREPTTSTEAPKVTVPKTRKATQSVNLGDLPTVVSPVSGLIADDMVDVIAIYA